MERTLGDVAEVPGVTETLVAGAKGAILASTVPASFDARARMNRAPTFNRTLERPRVSRRRRPSDFDLTSENGRPAVRHLREGALVTLCPPATNGPLLDLTANVVSRKVQDMLKESAPAAPPATAVAVEASAQPSMPARGDMQASAAAILNAAREHENVLRVMGEIAVHMRWPSAGTLLPALAVESTVLEMAARGAQALQVKALMGSLGWKEKQRSNAFYGTKRLRFGHPPSSTGLEVFLDNLFSYHLLESGSQLHLDERPPASGRSPLGQTPGPQGRRDGSEANLRPSDRPRARRSRPVAVHRCGSHRLDMRRRLGLVQDGDHELGEGR